MGYQLFEILPIPLGYIVNIFFIFRRQFNLIEDELLRYRNLAFFDKDMNLLENQFKWVSATQAYINRKHEMDKVIVFERAGCVFAFNFHPNQSYADYWIPVEREGGFEFKLGLCSDCGRYDGFDRVDMNKVFQVYPKGIDGRSGSVQIYLPSRVAIVLVPSDIYVGME